MDGAHKSAILLLSLDQALASEVLGKLPRDQVELITLAIANAENVTRSDQESVLDEFKVLFNSRPLMQTPGPETARELLERTLDQNDLEPIQQRVDEQLQAGPFAFLHNRHADDIRRLIEDEHPQTIALVAAQLHPGLSSQVVAGFAAERQAEILGRIARLGPTHVDVLAEIASLLQARIGRIPLRTGGVSRAADVLRESSRTTSNSVLQALDAKDTTLAASLRASLFSFKDLISLNDITIRIVLQETDHCSWAVALKGSPEPLRQRILAMLPPKLAEALRVEMNSVGPARLSEITSVQQQISQAVLRLESENQIELPKKDGKNRQSVAS